MNQVEEEENESSNSEVPQRLGQKLDIKTQYSGKYFVAFFLLQISMAAFYCFDQPAALYYIMREHFEVH
jgi:hypothetical protein